MREKTTLISFFGILVICLLGWVGASRAEEYTFDGPPPICPRWAFEPWVWEDYENIEESLLDLVDQYEAYDIPVGAVIIDSPWEAVPGPVTVLEVVDTANEDDWSVRHNLQSGDAQYGDRVYTFTDVPDRVAGAQWIRTANDSKVVTGDVANFVSRVDATVYIAHDERVDVKPDWLDGWEELDEYLHNDEQAPVAFKLFKKDVVENETVTLGPNTPDGSYACGMYTVIAQPSGEFSPGDDDYSQYNSYRWDRNRYPQAELMIDDLHDRNIRVIMWATGIMNKEAEYFEVVNDHYCYPEAGNCDKAGWWKNNFKKTAVHIDFRQEDARNWFRDKVAPLIRDGDNIYIDGWKCDAGSNAFYKSDDVNYPDFNNYYYASFYRVLKEMNPEGIIVSRAYSHQLKGDGLGAPVSDSPINWQGDFEGGFQGLSKQMDNIYTSAQMGYSAPGVEVGGYTIPPAACKISKASLIRYAQFGALTPLMENGGTDPKHEPWLHDTETVDIYRYYATLHSELVPYLFSYSVEANQTGTSILRGTDTAKAHHRLGEEIFTSIVVDGGNTYKNVDFPAGARWINYWNDTDVHTGGQTMTFDLPEDDLNRFPIFIRVGAIVPMNVCNNETGHGLTETEALEKPAYFNPEGKITLNIYPGGTSSFLYHHPTGDGIAYDDIEIEVDEPGETIDVSSDGQHVYAYILRIKSFTEPDSVTADGAGAFDWFYREGDHLIIAYLKGAQATVTVDGLEGYPLEKDLIADLVVNDTANAGDWSIRNNLGVGDEQYGDRGYAFTLVPGLVAGAQWIRTANDSKVYTGEVADFVLGADATVYIAHDERIGQKPDWLDDWTSLGDVLQNDEQVPVQFRLYQRDFGEDDVVGLGPNSQTGSYDCGMYTVIVVPVE